MNINNLPLTEGPIDIILKYSKNYSGCFRTCRFLRAVVDRIFKAFLKKDFETESLNPFLTYQRKKFALYSTSPQHGLNILEGPIWFISINEMFYAYANFNTVVRDRKTNSVVLNVPATPRNQFGFVSSNVLIVDHTLFPLNEKANKDSKCEAINIEKEIQPFVSYSIENRSFAISHNIVGINNYGRLDIFLWDSKKLIQTSVEVPEKIYYIRERLLIYSKQYLMEYDFINQKIINKFFITSEQLFSVIDLDNDFALVRLNYANRAAIIHFPTNRYLHKFELSDWTISGFDCMIYTGNNNSNTQRQYYLKNSSDELNHVSA